MLWNATKMEFTNLWNFRQRVFDYNTIVKYYATSPASEAHCVRSGRLYQSSNAFLCISLGHAGDEIQRKTPHSMNNSVSLNLVNQGPIDNPSLESTFFLPRVPVAKRNVGKLANANYQRRLNCLGGDAGGSDADVIFTIFLTSPSFPITVINDR